jgi:hypothetical protein
VWDQAFGLPLYFRQVILADLQTGCSGADGNGVVAYGETGEAAIIADARWHCESTRIALTTVKNFRNHSRNFLPSHEPG